MTTLALKIILTCLTGMLVGILVNSLISYFLKKLQSENQYFCKACKTEPKWYDKISAVLFLLLKGRCRSCGAKANKRFPFVELMNGILYVIVIMANGLSVESLLYCLVTSAFLVISTVDENTLEIPLPCNVFVGGIGILVCVLDFSLDSLFDRVLGFLVIGGILYLLYILSKGAAIGGGDVKLMAAVGLILGWKKVILAFLLGCIIGSVFHVTRMKISKAEHVLAMGPYLCIGSYLCMLWGDAMIRWYLGLMGL